MQRGVKICNSEQFFSMVDWFLTYDQSSSFEHWMGGG